MHHPDVRVIDSAVFTRWHYLVPLDAARIAVTAFGPTCARYTRVRQVEAWAVTARMSGSRCFRRPAPQPLMWVTLLEAGLGEEASATRVC